MYVNKYVEHWAHEIAYSIMAVIYCLEKGQKVNQLKYFEVIGMRRRLKAKLNSGHKSSRTLSDVSRRINNEIEIE